MTDRNTVPDFDRRQVLRGAGAVSTAALFRSVGVGQEAADDRVIGDEVFEQRQWGYKRTDLKFDASREGPTIVEIEGYAGSSRPAPEECGVPGDLRCSAPSLVSTLDDLPASEIPDALEADD